MTALLRSFATLTETQYSIAITSKIKSNKYLLWVVALNATVHVSGCSFGWTGATVVFAGVPLRSDRLPGILYHKLMHTKNNNGYQPGNKRFAYLQTHVNRHSLDIILARSGLTKKNTIKSLDCLYKVW